MVAFIAGQIGCAAKAFDEYAQRDETRRAHLGELQAYLEVRPFRREDYRAVAGVALDEATGTDRGDAIVSAVIAHLRERHILLPAALTLEKIGLAARARARKRALQKPHRNLGRETVAGLEELIALATIRTERRSRGCVTGRKRRRQRNLAGIVERLEVVRKLGVGPDREQRIHRARYAAIARKQPFSALNIFHASMCSADWRRWSSSHARWRRS